MFPEKLSIKRLQSSSFEVSQEEIENLKNFFIVLRKLDHQISRISPFELYESLWAILGIISRSYQLMLCCIDQVVAKNMNGFYIAARGLVETLCSIIWVNENPERLINLVQFRGLKIGRIMNVGYKKCSELKDIYFYLSNIVHCGRGSHLLGFRPTEEIPEKGVFGPFILDFSNDFAKGMVDLMVNIGSKINRELHELISHGENVVRKGKLMVQIKTKKQDDE